MEKIEKRIDEAVEIALDCSQYDGDHHKMWVIDQMLRVLLGENKYKKTIEKWCEEETEDEDWPASWDEGIAP